MPSNSEDNQQRFPEQQRARRMPNPADAWREGLEAAMQEQVQGTEKAIRHLLTELRVQTRLLELLVEAIRDQQATQNPYSVAGLGKDAPPAVGNVSDEPVKPTRFLGEPR